jgi:hypothetical protein
VVKHLSATILSSPPMNSETGGYRPNDPPHQALVALSPPSRTI